MQLTTISIIIKRGFIKSLECWSCWSEILWEAESWVWFVSKSVFVIEDLSSVEGEKYREKRKEIHKNIKKLFTIF